MRSTDARVSRSSRGFTVVELLVTIAIIAILAALLLPAVQQAREASRRVVCANNMRQIGLAMHQYVSGHGVFPAGQGAKSQSFLVTILAHLDGQPLYDAINHDVDVSGPENHTGMATRLSVFLCPSDTREPYGYPTSYAGNSGDGYYPNKSNGLFSTTDIPQERWLPFGGLTDGASTTAAVSEWLVSGLGDSDPRRAFHLSPVGAPSDNLAFEIRCRSLAGMVSRVSPRAEPWYDGLWSKTLYDHFFGINMPNCSNAIRSPAARAQDTLGTSPAASCHPSGANVLFADGHLVFVRESIALAAWRALGTRDGGEIVTID